MKGPPLDLKACAQNHLRVKLTLIYSYTSNTYISDRRVLYSDVSSNVRVEERHLVRLSYLPPHPDTEILRYQQVANLRHTFASLCRDKLGKAAVEQSFIFYIRFRNESRPRLLTTVVYLECKKLSGADGAWSNSP